MDEDEARQALSLAEEAAPGLTGPRSDAWLDRLGSQHDRLRDALRWFLDHGGSGDALRMAAAIWRFWMMRGHGAEGLEWLSAVLSAPGAEAPTPTRAMALNGAGQLAFRQGDEKASRAFIEEALETAREADDPRGEADALVGLSRLALRDGDYSLARTKAQQAMALSHDVGDREALAGPLHLLAASMRMLGENLRAKELYEESLALSEELGDRRMVGVELLNLGAVEKQLGDLSRAEELVRESIRITREVGEDSLALACLVVLANVAAASGAPERAGQLLGAVDGLLQEMGEVLDPDDQAEYEEAIAAARRALDGPAFDAVRRKGRALSLERATAFALK